MEPYAYAKDNQEQKKLIDSFDKNKLKAQASPGRAHTKKPSAHRRTILELLELA